MQKKGMMMFESFFIQSPFGARNISTFYVATFDNQNHPYPPLLSSLIAVFKREDASYEAR
ncbi:MAG: hypothetical protein C4527_23495 [Candidatus Omnitrophota bacterium]|jgi:hypothetical protein|nr:MAG: hypothetical protein C4527_23495 [Candidatus Omnitrophota bacterium]